MARGREGRGAAPTPGGGGPRGRPLGRPPGGLAPVLSPRDPLPGPLWDGSGPRAVGLGGKRTGPAPVARLGPRNPPHGEPSHPGGGDPPDPRSVRVGLDRRLTRDDRPVRHQPAPQVEGRIAAPPRIPSIGPATGFLLAGAAGHHSILGEGDPDPEVPRYEQVGSAGGPEQRV